MTTLTLTRPRGRPAGSRSYYVPKGRKSRIMQEIGALYTPMSVIQKHAQAFNWVADNASVLIEKQEIDPMRAILSYAGQAESKLGFVWRIGPREWQQLAASGVDAVRAKANDQRYLKGLED